MAQTQMAQTLWGMHAGSDGEATTLFLRQGHIALGWRELGGLGELPNDRAAFQSHVAATYPDEPETTVKIWTGQLYRFIHEMQIGDYVAFRPATSRRDRMYVFLGRVIGPYVYNPYLDSDSPNTRRIEWLRSVPANRFSQGALGELGSSLSLFQIDTHATEFFEALAKSK